MSGAGRIALRTLGVLVLSGAALFSQTDARGHPEPIHCLACPARERGPSPEPPRHTIMTQRVDAFDAWLTHLCGAKPVVIQTHRANLIAVLEDGPVTEPTAAEAAYLRSVFPKLGASIRWLDAHQLAHLLAFRLSKLQVEMADVLDLDGAGLVRREAGPGQPIASSHADVCVFSKQAGYDAFVDFRYDRRARPLEGAMFDQVPTGAMLMASAKEPAAARQFTFMASMQLLRRLSRAEPGLQGWLQLGLAHFFEDRCAGVAAKASPGATLPPDADLPGDWEAFVGDLITAGKAGDLGAMAVTPRYALSVRSRLQAWSMVRWLIARDPRAFAAMIRRLLHADPADAPAKALLGAMRSTFDLDLVAAVDEWKGSVKKSHAAAK